MTMTKALMAVAALTLTVAATPTLAHERDHYISKHERDHAEHRQLHGRINRAHERAHDEGFSSRREHRAYHRYLGRAHENFHEDHPGTRHDHRRWW